MTSSFDAVQPAMAFAADHLSDDVRLEVLARQATMSPFHLHRVFRDLAGETPKQFTSRLRLGHAAALLLTGHDSVLRVALTCGFESHEGFTRAFQGRFGIAPSVYRARGFAVNVTPDQAETHRLLVDRVGPCVGLYHIREDGIRRRETMTYSITKEEISAQPVLVGRRRVARSEIAAAIGEILPRVFHHAQQQGLPLTGQPFARYSEVSPGLMTIEPGMRVAVPEEEHQRAGPDPEGEDADIRADLLPGGPVAKTIHSGPYETLHEAYAALEAWMESEGLTPAGSPWETYVTDPTTIPDPKDWKTEVCWPVA